MAAAAFNATRTAETPGRTKASVEDANHPRVSIWPDGKGRGECRGPAKERPAPDLSPEVSGEIVEPVTIH